MIVAGSCRGAGRRSYHHTVCAGVQHVLLRGFRVSGTRAVHAQRGLLFPVRLRLRSARAKTGPQVA